MDIKGFGDYLHYYDVHLREIGGNSPEVNRLCDEKVKQIKAKYPEFKNIWEKNSNNKKSKLLETE